MKNFLKYLCITLAILLVGGGCGVIIGANVVNLDYSESEYVEYGEQQKQEGLEEGFENGQQVGYDNGYNAGQNVGYENGYNAGEDAGYDSGFEDGQTYKDPEKTYLEDIINGVALNIYKTDNYTFLSSTDPSFKGLYKLNTDGSVEQIYNKVI